LLECVAAQNRELFAALGRAYVIVGDIETEISRLLHLKPEEVNAAYADSGWPFPSGTDVIKVPLDVLQDLEAIPRDEPNIGFSGAEVEFRFQNKLSHYLHADLEHLSHRFRVSPQFLCESASRLGSATARGIQRFARNVLSFAVGCTFGRWDIRYATGERPAPDLPDPFDPLPVCPPGMLQGDDGLPLSLEEGRRLRAEGSFPLDIAWDGVLVDDPEHPLDIERRVRDAFGVIWGDRAEAIQQEACELLGVPTLREWFRRPAGFFADHLKRYSKSRRQAPIYWPLSSPGGRYTVWLYYTPYRHNLSILHVNY